MRRSLACVIFGDDLLVLKKKLILHDGWGSKKIKRWMPAPNILSSLACDIVGDDLLVLKKV